MHTELQQLSFTPLNDTPYCHHHIKCGPKIDFSPLSPSDIGQNIFCHLR